MSRAPITDTITTAAVAGGYTVTWHIVVGSRPSLWRRILRLLDAR